MKVVFWPSQCIGPVFYVVVRRYLQWRSSGCDGTKYIAYSMKLCGSNMRVIDGATRKALHLPFFVLLVPIVASQPFVFDSTFGQCSVFPSLVINRCGGVTLPSLSQWQVLLRPQGSASGAGFDGTVACFSVVNDFFVWVVVPYKLKRRLYFVVVFDYFRGYSISCIHTVVTGIVCCQERTSSVVFSRTQHVPLEIILVQREMTLRCGHQTQRGTLPTPWWVLCIGILVSHYFFLLIVVVGAVSPLTPIRNYPSHSSPNCLSWL